MKTCEDCKHAVLWGDSDVKANCYRHPPDACGSRPPIKLTDRACGDLEEKS